MPIVSSEQFIDAHTQTDGSRYAQQLLTENTGRMHQRVVRLAPGNDGVSMLSQYVTEVNLSPDNKKAHVRLAIEGNADQQAACMEAVEKAKGYIKHIVADRLDVFRLPDLYFDPDLAADVRSRVPSLLRRIRRGRARS